MGLAEHGKDWRTIAKIIGTKTDHQLEKFYGERAEVFQLDKSYQQWLFLVKNLVKCLTFALILVFPILRFS